MKFSIEKKSSQRKRKIEALREQMIKKEQLHIHDLVNYNQFLELYSKYGKRFSEEEFAKAFLDLLKTDLYSLKKNRCKILKREEISEYEIALLKLQLIKMFELTKGKEKSYIELRQLYESIPNKLSFVLFAEKVLDVTSHSVSCAKCNSSKNVTIFNKTSDTYFQDKSIEELKESIEDEIRVAKTKTRELKDCISQDRNLHIGDEITPDEFYEIYEIYGKKYYSHYDFARNILGLSEGKARGLINRKIEKGQIWNEEIFSLKYLYDLRKLIVEKEKLHINDRIETYEKFQTLFRKYSGILSEPIFAEEVLDISRISYKNLKAGNSETIILTDIDVPEDFWEDAKTQIKKLENVYNGKRITYDEFLQLYQKYGYVVWDVDFARRVLNISQEQFYCLKRGENKTTRIFGKKDKNLSKSNYDEDYDIEELKKLRQIVISENKLHIEQSISGKKFEEIYEKYGFGMSKKFFADKILDIKQYRLNCILRDETDNTTILTNENVDREYLKILRGIFFKSREHCTEDMINYQEFQRLYEIYGGKLSEVQFAEKILFITNDNLKQIREKQKFGRETKIFANLKLSDAYLANLKAKVIDKNLLYYRQNITPKFFRKIYRQTRTVLSEADFAKIILEVQQRQVYYKALVSKENETFRILSISGTNKNKDKFLEKQNETIKSMLEKGASYEEIAEATNLTLTALKSKVESFYKSSVDIEGVKKNYVLTRLRDGKVFEPQRLEELGIDDVYIKSIEEELKAQVKFEALQEKCFNIVDDLQETKHSKMHVRNYIKACKERYEGNFQQMSDRTLECLNSCLEFLEDYDNDSTKFFIKACISKSDFYRANSFITFSMQAPKVDTETKKSLQELRQYVRYAIKKETAINMISRNVSIREIVHSTDLSETEVRILMKKFKAEKQKT